MLLEISTFLLAVALSWILLKPFWTENEQLPEWDVEALTASDLQGKRERIQAAFSDLETDRQVGKISEEEFALSKKDIAQEAARLELEPHSKRLQDE